MTGFHAKTLQLLDAVNGILAEYDGPLTLRQVYYRLVAAQVLENTERAYRGLSGTLTKARQAGLVHDRLRILDATHLAAKVDLFRLPLPPPEMPPAQAPGSPDPQSQCEAGGRGRWGRRPACPLVGRGIAQARRVPH